VHSKTEQWPAESTVLHQNQNLVKHVKLKKITQHKFEKHGECVQSVWWFEWKQLTVGKVCGTDESLALNEKMERRMVKMVTTKISALNYGSALLVTSPTMLQCYSWH